MEKDIKSIIVLLTGQAMINLGEVIDPVTGQTRNDPEGAYVFIELLEVLETKTKGNLTGAEASFLTEVRENLAKVYQKKISC